MVEKPSPHGPLRGKKTPDWGLPSSSTIFIFILLIIISIY